MTDKLARFVCGKPFFPSLPRAGLAVYIHWPYCQALCNYCDFNKYVSTNIEHERMTRAYVKAIQSEMAECPHTHGIILLAFSAHYWVPLVSSIYFGGGTPSLMRPESVAAIIDAVRKERTLHSDIEACCSYSHVPL